MPTAYRRRRERSDVRDLGAKSHGASVCIVPLAREWPARLTTPVVCGLIPDGFLPLQVGPFGGNLVVSMRPYLPHQITQVDALTSRYPGAHGGPVHWGDPEPLGISMDQLPDPPWGEAVSIRSGEVPVFWACGVTPQTALQEARLPLAITHAPGHMFICDVLDRELEVDQASPSAC